MRTIMSGLTFKNYLIQLCFANFEKRFATVTGHDISSRLDRERKKKKNFELRLNSAHLNDNQCCCKCLSDSIELIILLFIFYFIQTKISSSISSLFRIKIVLSFS